MLVNPYLSFEGRCEEALDFYQQALGAQVSMLMRSKDAPPSDAPAPSDGCVPEGGIPGDKILHASFTVGGSTLMATDGMNSGKPDFKGVSLSLSVGTEAEATRLFPGTPPVQRAGRRWPGADAFVRHLLLPRLRHGGRPVWCGLVGAGGIVIQGLLLF